MFLLFFEQRSFPEKIMIKNETFSDEYCVGSNLDVFSLLKDELQALDLNPLLESHNNFSLYEFIFERFQLVITDFALQLMVVSISHSHSLV